VGAVGVAHALTTVCQGWYTVRVYSGLEYSKSIQWVGIQYE